MLIYEILSAVFFAIALIWAIRSKNPLYLGALVSGFLLFVFDWLWCGRDFFNATFNTNLTMIPGLNILGEQYPFSLAFNWAIGFGLLPLLLCKFHNTLQTKLGLMHFPVILAFAAAVDLLMEVALVTGLEVYTYHQSSEYLLWGVPWSNLWFGGGLLALPYFSFFYVQEWVPINARVGFSLKNEATWKGFFMSAAALWVPFFFLTVLQLFWYSAAAPWITSGRLF
jgi:hypothetical protein